MDVGRVRFVALFIALFCVFAANNSEGNRKLPQRFLDNVVSFDFEDIDEDVAELLWSHCTADLSQLKISSYGGVEFESPSLVKKAIEKAIADLSPKEKETILECLNEKTFTLHVEEESRLSKYEYLLPGWGNVPRRYLRRKRRHRVLKIAPFPGPAVSPVSLVAAPINQLQAPSPSPVPQPPSHPPAQTPEPSPPKELVNPPSPSDDIYHSRLTETSKNDDKNKNYMIAATVAGVVAGLALLAVFFLCCLKKNKSKVEPKEGQRDEKPLLNFSCSDLSAVSSQKSNMVNPSIINTSTTTANRACEAEAETSENTNANLRLPPGKTAAPPPGPPPPPPKPPAPAPPPPPKASRPPPNPPIPRPSPLGPHHRGRTSTGESIDVSEESEAPKAKLKPFFWDKVMASPDHSMVWHEIKAGSFQFNEEMMETLFGYAPRDKNKTDNTKDSPSFESPQFIQIIDPKKSQNLAILLKALNVTIEEVCDALKEGNELPPELIQTVLKMAPTSEEELKLRLYSGDVSHLGPAERFLKVMVDIPFAFKRLESLLFISTYQEEVSSIKESLTTLEVACKELRNSRLFLKLLEAVLKTGNRMNDGTYRGGAQAFKLETLLKLSDVKGTDGKTTLLHFVVHEIIRSEGLRAARRLRESQSMSSVKTEDLIEDSSHETEEYHRSLGLQVVAGLSNELENVRKAALIDNETLAALVSKLGQSLVEIKRFLETEMKSVEEGENEFTGALVSFIDHGESDIEWLIEEEKRIMALVKSTGDYFHGRAGKEEGSRLFVIIRDFLLMLDRACKDVKSLTKLAVAPKTIRKETLSSSPSQESRPESLRDYHRRLFPSIKRRQTDDDFSSDDES